MNVAATVLLESQSTHTYRYGWWTALIGSTTVSRWFTDGAKKTNEGASSSLHTESVLVIKRAGDTVTGWHGTLTRTSH